MRSHPEKPGTLGPEEPRLRCRKKAWQGNPVTQRRADLDAESPMASGGATAFGHRVLSRKPADKQNAEEHVKIQNRTDSEGGGNKRGAAGNV